MTASVVIACHTEERWPLLVRAIESAGNQTQAAAEIIVVVDHNAGLYQRLRSWSSDITVVPNASLRGASGARNTGAEHAATQFIAFLDDDAAAEPEWLAHIVGPFHDPAVVGSGGRVTPDWSRGVRPAWFPNEFDWVVGASNVGLPTENTAVRNVWAENMAVRADVFARVGGFRTGFGKLGGHSRPEDTDLCIRMAAAVPGGQWIYQVDAVVSHHVPPARSSYRFFIGRTYHEGRGKAELARLLPVASGALSSERTYVSKVLPLGVLRHLGRAVRRGQLGELACSINIVVGLTSTVWGFTWQKIVDLTSRDRDLEPADVAEVAGGAPDLTEVAP